MWVAELTCLAIAFVLAVLAGPAVIPLMRRLKFGQTERYNGVESHLAKNGTPTMGGWIFMIPVVLVTVVYALIKKDWGQLILPAVTLLFGAVGFVDDFLKVKKKNKDGFIWWQKLLVLIAISVGFACYMQFAVKNGASIDFMFLGKNRTISLAWIYIPFVAFTMLAESNAVNLTDGLDGLCAGSSILVFVLLAISCVYLFVNKTVSVFSATFVGALAGFLVFNYHPAKIFMGDTGSLAIGGALGAAALMCGHPFLLFFGGLLFVFEALSVLLQVGYFKISHGKRIFKMAPLHHHFEKCGWKELTVTYTFWAFVAVCCIVTYVLARGFAR